MSDKAERQKKPAIYSLQSLEIEVNDEIRRHLSAHYDLDSADADNEKESKRASEDGHFELILGAMKRPPAVTTCRVNLIRTTRKEVLNELQSLLSNNPNVEVSEDSFFPDVINIVPRLHRLYSTNVDGKNSKNGTSDRSSLSSLTGPVSEVDETSTVSPNEGAPIKPTFSNWPSRKHQGWPMSHRCIICDRFCGEAVLRGSDIFVMGVMAADSSIRAGEKVAVYADIPWKFKQNQKLPRGLKLEHYYGKCIYLGLGIAQCSRNEIFKKTQGIAITMSHHSKERVGPPLPPLCGVLPEKMMLQNIPSVFVGHALDPKPNDIILDMCSAPGGKASHLASLVRNKATIVACDKSKKKVATAKEMFIKMGASCIIPLVLDATKCCVEDEGKEGGGHDSYTSIKNEKDLDQIVSDAPVDNEGLRRIKKFQKASFDKILLDPPCSALGLRPKLFVNQDSLKELEKHAEYQRKFVDQAVKLLKVGGYMTYSTCTINGDENEGMVRHILQEYPCMELLPINLPSIGKEENFGLPGLDGFGLSLKERKFVRRFDPSSIGDTMGFFVALFRKNR
mmetsp:Transcript_18372/g.42384  ORF Transcript_18372/g.42384 Transcript_18372/m.42384 type:complete len:564 (+) Transcript_18372:48-1739(+)